MEDFSYSQKLLAEVLGTAMLVFVGVGSVPATLIIGGSAPFTMAELGMISFAFAMIVVAMIYAIGHVSGCQINPAITVALALTGKMPWRSVPGYIVAQVAGATLGAYAIIGVLGHKAVDVGLGVAAYHPGVHGGQAFVAEAVGTFILAFVVFGAIHAKAPSGFAGLAIGVAVFAAIVPVAPATSAVYQPGAHARPDAGPATRRRQGRVGPAAHLPDRRVRRRSRRRRAVRRHDDRTIRRPRPRADDRARAGH